MNIEIINTGTELLLGSTLNTHGAWLGQELLPLGIRVERQVTVPDGDGIRSALAESVERADVVIVTGGIGPTSDDITREVTAEVMGLDLIEDEAAVRSIKAFFAERSRVMPESNLKQAQHPCGAEVMTNPHGTAPGVYVPPRLGKTSPCAVFLLPGPPNEMKPMFFGEVLPRLRALSSVEEMSSVKEYRFIGVGESALQDKVDEVLHGIEGLEIGYCAHVGSVDLRLIGSETALTTASELIESFYLTECYSCRGQEMEEVVVELLSAHGQTVSFAESCTGGAMAAKVTDVAGASTVFEAGYVTYSNGAKARMLGVTEETLKRFGAVSEEVAKEMALGALADSGSDYAVAVTGVAGPGGGSEEKPVGTVWLALAARDGSVKAVKKFHPRGRAVFKQVVVLAALNLLRLELM